MSITDTLQVRVKSITWEADGILSFELCPMPPRKDLPPSRRARMSTCTCPTACCAAIRC
jgi:hypothetical protein